MIHKPAHKGGIKKHHAKPHLATFAKQMALVSYVIAGVSFVPFAGLQAIKVAPLRTLLSPTGGVSFLQMIANRSPVSLGKLTLGSLVVGMALDQLEDWID